MHLTFSPLVQPAYDVFLSSSADSPICKSAQKWQYGIALEEQAKILCQVDANPVQVAFQWTFNNSAEIIRLAEPSIINNLTVSLVSRIIGRL